MRERFIFIVLFVLVFRSNLSCGGGWINGQWYQVEVGKKKTIDISDYLEKKCEVCDKPFNYTIVIDSNSKVINDKTEEYLGINMHKECYRKLITFLILDYNKRKKEYDYSIFIGSVNWIQTSSTTLLK